MKLEGRRHSKNVQDKRGAGFGSSEDLLETMRQMVGPVSSDKDPRLRKIKDNVDANKALRRAKKLGMPDNPFGKAHKRDNPFGRAGPK